MRLDNPVLVRREYASEEHLAKRKPWDLIGETEPHGPLSLTRSNGAEPLRRHAER